MEMNAVFNVCLVLVVTISCLVLIVYSVLKYGGKKTDEPLSMPSPCPKSKSMPIVNSVIPADKLKGKRPVKPKRSKPVKGK